MRIVPQVVSVSYSLFSPQRLLSAPPRRLELPAPHVAGLLPAPASPRIEFIDPKTQALEAFLAQLGPIRSREDMNADLHDMIDDYRDFAQRFSFMGGSRKDGRHD